MNKNVTAQNINQANSRIGQATHKDIPVIMQIINSAKARLKKSGVDQWQDGYPNEERIFKDISEGTSYLFYENGEVVATFALFFGNDPTYKIIKEGEWLTEHPYSVVHRIAVEEDKLGMGVIGRLLEKVGILSLEKGYHSIRMDTHPDNINMQRALLKNNFSYCGHIFLENNEVRYAYEKQWEKPL